MLLPWHILGHVDISKKQQEICYKKLDNKIKNLLKWVTKSSNIGKLNKLQDNYFHQLY